jgi:hypothetical protein
VPDTLAGPAIDLMEMDFAFGLGGEKNLNAKRNQGDANLSAPKGAHHG